LLLCFSRSRMIYLSFKAISKTKQYQKYCSIIKSLRTYFIESRMPLPWMQETCINNNKIWIYWAKYWKIFECCISTYPSAILCRSSTACVKLYVQMFFKPSLEGIFNRYRYVLFLYIIHISIVCKQRIDIVFKNKVNVGKKKFFYNGRWLKCNKTNNFKVMIRISLKI
jgi:hypothetical protein